MGILDVYAESIANWISGGAISARNSISAIGLKTGYDRIITKQYVSKVWVVTGLPTEFNYYLTDLIRGHMYEVCPSVKTIIHTHCQPSELRANDETFKRQLARASESYDRYEQIFASLRSDEQMTGKVFRLGRGATLSINRKQFDKVKDCRDSYQYVYSELLKGQGLYQVSYFIQCFAHSNRELQKYKRHLQELLESNKVQFEEIRGNMQQYLLNYGAAAYVDNSQMKVQQLLCSAENLTSFIPTRSFGLARSKGIVMGLDVDSKLPAMVDYFDSGAGQTIVYLGKTGSGKTYAAFYSVSSFLDKDHHVSVIDIKGNEWDRMLKLSEGVRISLDGTEPYFVNTLRLDDLEVDSSICGFYYRNAIEGTVRLFSIMVALDPREGNQRDLEMLVETAVIKVFSKNNVMEEVPETFANTANLKYEMVLETLEELRTSASYTEEQRNIIKLIKTRCSMFFSAEGRFGKAFQRELSLGAVINAPLVVYAFNKNSGTTLDALDSIRKFMAQFLDSKKHFYRKTHKLQSICIYEELQRCVDQPELISYISSKVTGGRSDNVTNIILLNSIESLNHPNASAIKSNISTFVIGKVNTGDVYELKENFGFDKEEEYLTRLSTDEYEHCFYLKYDTGTFKDSQTIKVIFPDDMFELLNTRDRAE